MIHHDIIRKHGNKGGGFDPTQLTKGVFWLDFKDLTGMYQDEACTIPVTAIGQQISCHTDKLSGIVAKTDINEYGSGVIGPTLHADGADFNGTITYLKLPVDTLLAGCYGAGNDLNIWCLCETDDFVSSGSRVILGQHYGGSSFIFRNYQTKLGFVTISPTVSTVSASAVPAGFNVHGCTFDNSADTQTVIMNGVADGSNSRTADLAYTGADALMIGCIGREAGGSLVGHFDGRIRDIVVSGEVTAEERSLMDAFMASRI